MSQPERHPPVAANVLALSLTNNSPERGPHNPAV